MNADLSVFIRVIRVYNYRAMKATLAILLLLFLPQDPGVEVLKSSWSKIRIGWSVIHSVVHSRTSTRCAHARETSAALL